MIKKNMMKRLVYIICFCLPIICFGQNVDKGFLIEVEVEGIQEDSIILEAFDNKYCPVNQTVAIVDGKFTIKGKVKRPMCVSFWQAVKDKRMRPTNYLTFYLDNYDYKIKLVEDSSKVFTKEPNQVLYQKFADCRTKRDKKREDLSAKYGKLESKLKTQEEKDELKLSFQGEDFEILEKASGDQINLILENHNLLSSIDQFYSIAINQGLRIREVQKYTEKFTGDVLNSKTMRQLKAFIYSKTEVKEGNFTKDFTIYRPDGTPEQLIGTNGKIRFIHIGVFKKQRHDMNSRAKKIYSKYKDKDIVFKAVSLQSNLDKLNKSLMSYEFPFPIYASDRNRIDGLFSTYGLNCTPCFMIFDKDGKLIKYDRYRKLEDLENLLNSLL